MSELSSKSCEACRAGAPKVEGAEREELLKALADWQVKTIDHIDQLEKTFKFKNFLSALAFTNKVGEMAESEDHHPAILTEWGQVVVTWWTHKIKGLHENDFICAAKTDDIFKSCS